MPIDVDILDHGVLGPILRRGMEQGRQQGLQEGMQRGVQEGIQRGAQEGRREGRQAVLHQMLEVRFGTLPLRVANRLSQLSVEELDNLAVLFVHAKRLEELFPF